MLFALAPLGISGARIVFAHIAIAQPYLGLALREKAA